MKKAVKLSALSLAFALGSSVAMASDNIAFVNSDYLFVNHPARQAELQKLDQEFKAPIEKLKAEEKALTDKKASFEKDIDGKINALKKDAPKLRQAEIKKRQDAITQLADKYDAELQKLGKEYQQHVAEFQQKGQQRENEINQKLLSDIQKASVEVAKSKNFTVVLDGKYGLAVSEGKDITDDVLKALPKAK